jgi:hypothetical protein
MNIICLAIATLFLIYMWNKLIMSNEYDIEENITFLTQKKLGLLHVTNDNQINIRLKY